MKITIVQRDGEKRIPELYKNFDVVKDGEIYIAIGGDGTFIKAAQMTEKPVLWIRDEKWGSIGYHSDVRLDDLGLVIKKLKAKDFYIEPFSRKIEVAYKNKKYFGVNEVRLNNIVMEVSFKVFETLGRSRIPLYPFVMSGDGLIVSTKMGSTAYNSSAGGPIVLDTNIMCVTFVNPDAPYSRPLVMNSENEVEVEIVKYDGILMFDNTKIATVKMGDKFKIKLSSKMIKIVRLNGMIEGLSEKVERRIRSKLVTDFKDK
ncbi:MAG: hypothetical protein ABSA33_04440 [Candidatus Micrarchaeaceae archaeon]|jgi:NAD+ kinase